MIQGLRSEYIDSVWEAVWAVLHRAFIHSGGEFTEETVYNGIKAKSMQLWVDVEGDKIVSAGVTQISLWPETKVCWILGFTSDVSDHMSEYHELIERWAKSLGCSEIRMKGRKGWMKRLEDFGYEFRHVEMAKQLGE